MTYYTSVILLTWFTLAILSILVRENDRISKKDKIIRYFAYAIIAVSSLAEWSGVMLNGCINIPGWFIKIDKFADYALTPIAGGIIVLQFRERNIFHKLIIGTIVLNIVFQFISIFTGWVFYVDETNHYAHGRFYFIYIIFYLSIITFSIVEFAIYGRRFRRQNRFSLFAIVVFIIGGIALQELLGAEIRTAYISLTIGFTLLFIHYSEFSQLAADDKIHEQMIQITIDPLTSVANRHAYAKELHDIAKAGIAENTVVFSIDINGLKKINDTFGHSAGDELICAAAHLISIVFEQYGMCYRTGGDEFVVLSRMEKDRISVLVQQLEEKVRSWKGKAVTELSLSIGSACASDYPDVSMEKLIGIADEIMYKAKLEYYIATGKERRIY